MGKIIEFSTPRLRLRQWKTSDWDAFAEINADPEVMAHFPCVLDRDASDAIANRIYADLAVRGWGLWAVEVPQVAPFIGFVGLHVPAYDIPSTVGIEIGWRLARAHWGKGYATEAASAVLAVAFDKLQLPEVVSFAPLQNRRSQALMERLGMRCRDERFDHPMLPEGHGLRTHALYRLTREEWCHRQEEEAYAAKAYSSVSGA